MSLVTRLRRDYFGSPLDALVSLVCLALLVWLLPPVLRWAVIDATWSGASRADCAPGGACWALVRQRWDQFVYGFYPASERWRPNLLAVWLLAILAAAMTARLPAKRRVMALLMAPYPFAAGFLLVGGFAGLPLVETREWGGLMLTLVMTLGAGLIAFPLGILLALGRRSKLGFIRGLAIVFIEFWRGVPILAVIFLASILLPLIMPQGVTVDRLVRAVVGLGLVIAAYMAEVVRGGLQAVPDGQAEAAKALGLSYWRSMGLVVLPQALRVAIPGLANETIALVKNTTLVLIVSLFGLLGIVQAALADPKWIGLTSEAYAFAGLVFWLICFAISRSSLALEKRLRLTRRG